MPNAKDNPNVRPRAELGEFLKKKRLGLHQADYGIAREGKGIRRTKGLRREDIAHLTHVSLSWYTWLEQGKDIRVSVEFLSRLSDILRLAPAEHRYLLRLCGQPTHAVGKFQATPEIGEHLIRLLETIRGAAFVINMRWDVLAANRYAEALFGIKLADQRDRPNVLELMFFDEAHMALMPDWERDAQKAVAKFRLDTSESESPEMSAMVTKLREDSAAFDRLWRESGVAERSEETRTLLHPRVGELSLGYTLFSVGDRRDLRLNVYVAADEATERKLDQLLSP